MDESFVVGLRRDEVLRRRTAVRRTRRIGAVVTLGLGAVVLGLSLGLVLWNPDTWIFGALMVVAFLPLLAGTLHTLRTDARFARWYNACDLPPFAFRMTPAALELGVEGAAAPVVLPWSAVQGLRRRRAYGQQVLNVMLRIDVVPSTPGVSGLEQPAVQAMLSTNSWSKPVGHYGVACLDQPVEAIDQALRHFSQGYAGVR